MADLEISIEEIKEKLDKINVSISSRPDMIHLKILYELREELAYLLMKIFICFIKKTKGNIEDAHCSVSAHRL